MITVGIDPGVTGAIGAVDGNGNALWVCDLPVSRERTLAWISGDKLRDLLIVRVGPPRGIFGPVTDACYVVERVTSRPGQGAPGMYKLGTVLGSILATLEAHGYPIHLVTPQAWKRRAGLARESADEKDSVYKARSIDRARLLFPNMREQLGLAKHDGRAEALLMAYYFTRSGADHE